MKGRFKWLFIGNIPLLLPSRGLAKQMQVEFWLGSFSIPNLKPLTTHKQKREETLSYIS